jgi:hypothetical protein
MLNCARRRIVRQLFAIGRSLTSESVAENRSAALGNWGYSWCTSGNTIPSTYTSRTLRSTIFIDEANFVGRRNLASTIYTVVHADKSIRAFVFCVDIADRTSRCREGTNTSTVGRANVVTRAAIVCSSNTGSSFDGLLDASKIVG